MSQGETPISAVPASAAAEQPPLLHDLIRQGRSFSGRERHCCFLNLRDGTFGTVSAVSGLDLPDDGRALCQVDWDADGDLDFWFANRNGPQLRFMQNDLAAENGFIQFALEGTISNRDAIGARVELLVSTEALPQVQTVTAGSGFLAQSTKVVHFGLGPSEADPPEFRVVVHWPHGAREEFGPLTPNRRYHLREQSGEARPVELPVSSALPSAPLTGLEGLTSASVRSGAALALPSIRFRGARSDKVHTLDEHSGPVLLNLWATWCAPCLEELQAWGRAGDALESAGVQVVALAVNGLGPTSPAGQPVDDTVNRLALPFQFGFASVETATIVQLVQHFLFDHHRELQLPTSLLLDSDRRVIAFYTGQVRPQQVLADLAAEAGTTGPLGGAWYRRRPPASPFQFVRSMIEHDLLDEASAYVETHRRSLAGDPEFAKLLSHLGAKMVAAGKRGAVAHYEDALARAGESADHYYNLGLAKQSRGDLPGAIQDYERALQLDANHLGSHNNLAAALASTGQLEAALPHFRRVVQLNPAYANGRVNLANVLIGKGDLEGAVRQLREAIKLEPDLAKAHNNLAVALHRLGKTEEARKYLQEAKRLSQRQ